MVRDLRQLLVATAAVARDRRNRAAYGPQAPRVAELIWVNPSEIQRYIRVLPRAVPSRNGSAVVIDYRSSGVEECPLAEKSQVRSCFQHWLEGVPWEQTDDYATLLDSIRTHGKAVGCRSEAELRRRFNRLDEIFKTIRESGAFKTQKELKPWNFREYGGVQVSIDASGRPILNRVGGYHRMAIAHILKLKRIPAMIGLVDINAIEVLPRYRNPDGTEGR
jgi:hypothetical protein